MTDGGEENQAPVEVPAESPEPKPRRRGTGWLVLLLLLLLLVVAFGGVMVLAPQYLPPALRLPATIRPAGTTAPIATSPLAPQVEAMEQRLTRLQEHVGELQRKLAHLEQQDQANQALAQRLEQLEQKLAALPKVAAPASGASAGDVAALAQRLGALEQKQSAPPAANPEQQHELAALRQTLGGLEQQLKTTQGEIERLSADKTATSRQMALMLAVQRLATAASGSGSFAEALRPVQDLAQGADAEAAMKTLRGLQGGVPSLPALQAAFGRDVADHIVRAGKVSADSSWWRKTWDRITAPVVIRRTGEVPGNAPDAIVARAEQRLAHGDLAAAAQEIAALQGEPAKAAADWLAQARNRLAVDRAVVTLQNAALEQLAQPAKAGK